MTILLFLLILAILIFVHELGHFLVAKWSGIRVDEFAIGFPPRLLSFTKGETKYTINLIPFGGFVKIFGENPDEESIAGPDKSRSFVHKPKSIQALVLVAGVTFNMIFAWILISLAMVIGMQLPQGFVQNSAVKSHQILIVEVTKDSPAYNAGLKEEDTILEISRGMEVLRPTAIKEIQDFIGSSKDTSLSIIYLRNNATSSATFTPVFDEASGKARAGIAMYEFSEVKIPLWKAPWEGLKETISKTKEITVSIFGFFGNVFIGKGQFAEVSGPVGIARMVGDTSRLGFAYLLLFTALISINLAVINLIPFPALDGGRLLFVLIEKIKGSPLNPKFANISNALGFLILITLMVIVTYHDIIKLIIK